MKWIKKLTVDPLTVDCWYAPPDQQSTVLIVDHLSVDCWPSHCWLLIWLPPGSTVNSVDRQLLLCWLLTLSLLTVDLPPQDKQSTVLIVNHLSVDCWHSLCWLLIWLPPGSTVNSVDRQLPFCWLLTLSLLTVDLAPPRINSQQCWSSIAFLLTVDPLTVDCWSAPPGSTVNSVDHRLPLCWLLTLSLLTVDLPPHGQLYVAFSRVQAGSSLAVCLNNPDGFTWNIVYQEVLWHCSPENCTTHYLRAQHGVATSALLKSALSLV